MINLLEILTVAPGHGILAICWADGSTVFLAFIGAIGLSAIGRFGNHQA
jgi:hypothetical protein